MARLDLMPKGGEAPVTVVLADDHALVRRGFRLILEDDPEIVVVGEASNGLEAVRLVLDLNPRVIVMDLSMPLMNGLQASMEITLARRSTAILSVSMHSDIRHVEAAFSAGAAGYLPKGTADIDLALAVKKVAMGRMEGTSAVAKARLEERDADKRLTPRERQVLHLIAGGKSSKEIAGVLEVSVNTVRAHRANILSALDVHSTAKVLQYGLRNGFMEIL